MGIKRVVEATLALAVGAGLLAGCSSSGGSGEKVSFVATTKLDNAGVAKACETLFGSATDFMSTNFETDGKYQWQGSTASDHSSFQCYVKTGPYLFRLEIEPRAARPNQGIKVGDWSVYIEANLASQQADPDRTLRNAGERFAADNLKNLVP